MNTKHLVDIKYNIKRLITQGPWSQGNHSLNYFDCFSLWFLYHSIYLKPVSCTVIRGLMRMHWKLPHLISLANT